MKTSESKLKDFIAYTVPKSAKRKLYGVWVGIAAWSSLILLITILLGGIFTTNLITQGNPLFIQLSVLIAVFVAWAVIPKFMKLVRRGKRYRINTKAIMDSRDPILYLRSFREDLFSPKRPSRKQPEEFLASVLDDVGPVVAVGMPGEELPALGATRLYFEDNEWREKVKSLMSLSRLVFIQVTSRTPAGLDWEINTAKNQLKPEQLVFSFVAWHELKKYARRLEYELFRNDAERCYGISLPEKFNDAYFVFFEENWEPQLASVNKWERALLSFATSVSIREALRPVLAKRGINLGGRYKKSGPYCLLLIPFLTILIIILIIR